MSGLGYLGLLQDLGFRIVGSGYLLNIKGMALHPGPEPPQKKRPLCLVCIGGASKEDYPS